MRAFVPSCYNNSQAASSAFSKVQLYPRESSLLGMEKGNIPPTKKAKLSLSLKKSRKPRFHPVSEDKLKGMTVPYVPKNTEQSSKLDCKLRNVSSVLDTHSYSTLSTSGACISSSSSSVSTSLYTSVSSVSSHSSSIS